MRHVRIQHTYTALVLAFSAVVCAEDVDQPIPVTSTRQLFLDDHVVDRLHNVERTFHAVTKHPQNPILIADRSWEGIDAYLVSQREKSPDSDLRSRRSETPEIAARYGGWVLIYGTVLFDEGDRLFKIWYQTVAAFESGTENVVCFATSRDGIEWDKPDLGLIDYRGSKANNIVVRSSEFANFDECFCVIKDRQAKDAARRYKAIFWAPQHDDHPHSVWSATSPDGIQWRPSEQPILGPVADATSFFYDHLRDRYVAVPRPLDDQISKSISFSDDFQTWTKPRTVLRPLPEKEHAGESREQIYNMYPFTYESLYLGIAQVYYWHPRWALEGEWMFSRDCVQWVRPEPWRPHVPVGGPGEFDRANNAFSSAGPIRVGDELYFYYSGRSYRHREYHQYDHGQAEQDSGPWEAAIGLATLRVDGFASVNARYGPDRHVTTRPLLLHGRKLFVNAKCDWGSVRVGLLAEDGTPWDGFGAQDCDPLRRDATRIPISWNGVAELPVEADQPVRLRFVMENARLYSFWVE